MKNSRHDVNNKYFFHQQTQRKYLHTRIAHGNLFSLQAFSKRCVSYIFNGQEQYLKGHVIKFLLNSIFVNTFPMLWLIRKQVWASPDGNTTPALYPALQIFLF